MANLIIKPASASDDLKLQDGAGADIVTVDTNKGGNVSPLSITLRTESLRFRS